MVGLDNINDYYDVRVKHGRLRELGLAVPEAEADSDERGHGSDHGGGYGGGYGGGAHELVTSSTYPNLRFIRMDLEDKEYAERRGLRARALIFRNDGDIR